MPFYSQFVLKIVNKLLSYEKKDFDLLTITC